MLKFSAFDQAKAQAKVNHEQNKEQYEVILKEAIDLFEKATKSKHIPELKKAMEHFATALKYKASAPQPYYYMAVGFFLVNNRKLAEEYLKIVKKLDAGYPGVDKLTLILSK
jgi:hypothetical protein